MAEKKSILSRLFRGADSKATKPAPGTKAGARSPKVAKKAAATPAGKSAAKPPAKPVQAKPSSVVKPEAPRPGKPSIPPRPTGSHLAPSRPANRPQAKPDTGVPNPPARQSVLSTPSSSRPANRPQGKPGQPPAPPKKPVAARPAAVPVRTPLRPPLKPIARPAGIERRIAPAIISATGKRTIRELDARGKRVFLRVDFNVPLSDGRVVDDSRIRAAVPTIEALLKAGASVVMASHLGRPDGRVVDGLRLRPAAERLSQFLKINVPTTGDALGVGTEDAVRRMRPGELLLLENVRFHAGEEKNDPAFAARLAAYGDVFVNDAFGTAHRAHASVVGVAGFLPSYVGLLMEREVEALSNLLDKPARPFAAIVGGGKVSGKVAVLEALVRKVDLLILGGGVANTFLVASGRTVGKSLYESKMVDDARRILRLAQERGVTVLLPTDGVVAKEIGRAHV